MSETRRTLWLNVQDDFIDIDTHWGDIYIVERISPE